MAHQETRLTVLRDLSTACRVQEEMVDSSPKKDGKRHKEKKRHKEGKSEKRSKH